MSMDYRSPERSVQVLFRVAARDKEEMRRRADAHGVTLQDYLVWKALELDAPPEPLRDGRKPRVRPTPDLFEEKLSA